MRAFILTAATLVLSLSLVAQAPGPRGRRGGNANGDGEGMRPDRQPNIEQLADFLKLTDEQVTTLAGVLQSRGEAIRDNMQAIREKQTAAREELASDNPNPTLVGQLLLDAKSMQGVVKERTNEFVAAAQEVLDPIQKARLSSLGNMVPFQREVRQAQTLGLLPNEAGDFRLGGGGPGGRGGPGGPGGRGGPGPDGGTPQQ